MEGGGYQGRAAHIRQRDVLYAGALHAHTHTSAVIVNHLLLVSMPTPECVLHVPTHPSTLPVPASTHPGTGFPEVERERLGLRGLLPPRVVSMRVQV